MNKTYNIKNDFSSTNDRVIQILKSIYDPEIKNMNIWDLGLIYSIFYPLINTINIEMTLTSPACPLLGVIRKNIRKKIQRYVYQIRVVNIFFIFNPNWKSHMINNQIKLRS